MLANGATLSYKETATATSYTVIPDLKEIPDLGVEPEKVENTALSDGSKRYENGIGDPGDMTYKFRYDNSTASSAFRVCRGLADSGKVIYWKETAADGTTCEFSGQCAIKRNGGGVNAAIEFELAISLASDLDYTDPV